MTDAAHPPPPKPATLSGDLRHLPPALAPLVAEPRWVVWRWAWVPDRERWTKVPYQPHRPAAKARSNDPSTWEAYETALCVVEAREADGIGFMLHDSDVAAFDIDDCRDPQTGDIAPWAWTLIDEAASYTEVTVSGTGVRIIGHAYGKPVHRNQPYPGANGRVETYRRAARYIVVTGLELKGAPWSGLADLDRIIDATVAKLDAAKHAGKDGPSSNGHGAEFDFNSADPQLPRELLDLIRNGAPVGDRSDQFYHVVGWLKDLGYTVEAIEALLGRYPRGIARKYQGRLRAQIEECYRKTADRAPGGSGAKGTSGQGPSAGDQPTPIEIHWHGEDDGPAARPMLVKDLLPERGSGLLSGQWGTFKTFVVLDLAGSVMTNQDFAGRPVRRRGGVLFIAAEGASEVSLRLKGLTDHKLDANGTRVVPPRLPFAWIEECPSLLGPEALDTLATLTGAVAQRIRTDFDLPLALVVIDTVAAGAGFTDENASAETITLMKRLNELSRRTGALVLGVDHFGKMVETGTRGSSAKEAGADVVLALLSDRDIAGNVSNTRMAVRKLRGGVTGGETAFNAEVVEIGRDEYDDPLTTCIIKWRGDAKRQESPTSRKERWPQSLRVFRNALNVALIEDGKPVRPFGNEGPEVRAVTQARVRTEFMAAYPAEGEDARKRAEAKTKAFKRALRTALDRGLVVSRDLGGVDHLWLVDKD